MKQLPRTPIAHLPTPIEELDKLRAVLGGPRLLVKRDDQTGLAFGGNKTRKLEYLIAEAQSHNAKTLITAGAIQSNHCRQTAAAAARAGMDCILVLSGEEPELPEGNTFLDVLFGAELVWTTREKRDADLSDTYQQAEAVGREPFLIPYGGSNPTGGAAYAYAMQELKEQGVEPDWIVFATSSGGTHAGMLVGAAALGMKTKILGISADEKAGPFKALIAQIANGTAELLDVDVKFTPDEILVNDEYIGAGYAIMGAPEREAINLFARHEGLLVDPVYTGRAAVGLIDLIRKGFFKEEETVLFWHTGGQTALFADEYRRGMLGK